MSRLPRPAESPTTPDGRATWREWWGLVALVVPALVLGTDITVLFFAMPALSADLNPGPSQTMWILYVYGFFVAGWLITMGRLAARVGARRLLLVGAASFAVLSAVAAYATNPETLIAARALLGVAGAAVMPATYALLRTMFTDDGQRRFAIAVLFSVSAGGGAVGPLLGGALLEFFWWGSVFLANVPPMVLVVVACRWLVPEHREEWPARLDLTSVALSLAGMLAVVYGLQSVAVRQESAQVGPVWPQLGVLALGTVLVGWFVRRQRGLREPLLDLSLFRQRIFGIALATLLLTGIGLVGVFYLYTQYLQLAQGLSPLRAGLWTLPFVVAQILGGVLAPAVARWARPVTVVAGGLLAMAGGLTLLALLTATVTNPVPAATLALAVAGLGHGVAMALASDLIISHAPPAKAGSAGAAQEVSGELGAALGIAVGGTVGLLAYRATLGDTVPPEVPDAAAEAALASVHEGVRVAEEHGALLGAIQDAFTQGLQTYAGIAAVLLAVVAGVVAVLLRESRRGGLVPEPAVEPPVDPVAPSR